MSTRDLLLAELYRAPRNEQAQALAARHAPVLYFDAHEPFLPLAAGYTIFTQDGPSPSFKRTVELSSTSDLRSISELRSSNDLRSTGDPRSNSELSSTDEPDSMDELGSMDETRSMSELRPEHPTPAALAIEYAIWWDWDIHHLYELEHVWIYLDAQEQPVRVEGSWHGKFYHIPLKLEDGRAVLLSEPGKHAFAPDPSWFQQRAREHRRAETQAVSAPAHVLINDMFADKIRYRAFDAVLARSFLVRQAFTPAGRFNRRFTFLDDWLVPWPALRAWIPERVNAVLEHLEGATRPADYRALRLDNTECSLAGLQSAGASGADAVMAPLTLVENRLVLVDEQRSQSIGLDEALEFCRREPMGLFLELASANAAGDATIVDQLAWFVRARKLSNYVVVSSADAGLLARYASFVANGVTAIQLSSSEQDPLRAARQCGAAFVHLRQENLRKAALDPEWIRRVHDAGLGIISWPVEDRNEYEKLQRLGVDILWANREGYGWNG